MRIVFFGAGEFGLPTLQALCRAHQVTLVVTQPDRPAGRRRQMTPTPVAQWAGAQGLSLLQADKVGDPSVIQAVAQAGPEALVVVAFGQKIPRAILDLASLGPMAAINLHASLLPKYRGAGPVAWAILRGETVSGNTVIRVMDRMDGGEILAQEPTPISPRETAGELHDRLAALGPALVLDVLAKLGAGTLEPRVQDESQATSAPKISRREAVVDFSQSADQVRCRIHGLTPWPGITLSWTELGAARHTLLVRRVESRPQAPAGQRPGTLMEEGLVATGSGAIRLLEVQPPGKRQMTWDEYSRGHRIPPGTVFSGSG